MAEQVTVKSFGAGNPWSSDDGKISLTFFETVFDRNGSDFTANWGKKEGEPTVGESLEGEFYQKDGKWRFRKASKPQGGGSGSGGSFNARPSKSPDQQASIERQVALKVLAPRICKEGLTDDVRSLVQELERFIGEAAGGAGGGGGLASPSTPAPSQTPATHEEFHGLLEKAGVNSNAARVVTDYALTNMSAEEQDAALGMLADENRAKAAVKRLSEKAEAHYGSSLPGADRDEAVPF